MNQPDELLVIDLNDRGDQCCICGEYDEPRWGVPVNSSGLIVSNDYVGDWGGRPACRKCWAEHEQGQHVGTEPRF